ncbi:MAG: glycogen synthase GlgA [Calditrichaceae bacterium]
MDSLKICFVSSEIVPFAKTGGLADVSGALGKYLHAEGHDIRLVMPFYSSIDLKSQDFRIIKSMQNLELWFSGDKKVYSVFTAKLPGTHANVYFIHCPSLFDRSDIYTNDEDEHIRFALLARASLEICQRMNWAPDILHCNDWQTALIPAYLKSVYSWDKLFEHTKTVLTIHNIGYQGIFAADKIDELGLMEYSDLFDQDDLYTGQINFLKTGITHADKITTVSRTYAEEIQTESLGEGLNQLLQSRSEDLSGILNGVDYDEWNPGTDKLIPYNYSENDLSGKEKNKIELLSRMGLKYNPEIPVAGIVSRLAEQKGIELLYSSLPFLLENYDIQFVVLGNGQALYEQFFEETQNKFPNKLAFFKGYNNELAHLIEAGADMFIMPSRYEPCGLNQIYSLKYGTVPVVRKTGGLADTVELYNRPTGTGTGFVFEHYASDALSWAVSFAIETYRQKNAWKKLMLNGMKKNYSWEIQSHKYVNLYRKILE